MLSTVFTFAPIPLTNELSPLAHAHILIRKHQEANIAGTKPRYRVQAPSTPLDAATPQDIKIS